MKPKNVILLCLNLIVVISCSNEISPDASVTEECGSRLVFEKIKMPDGTIRITTEYQYNEAGQLASCISYNAQRQGVVSSKQNYFYEGTKLVRTTGMSDVSSSTEVTHYIYFYSTYEYDQDLLIKRNSFLKREEVYEQRSYTVYEYNASSLPVKQSVFLITGELTHFSTYAYDNVGNISSVMEYDVVNKVGLTLETTYEHDSKKNPYKGTYTALELIPYSINSNNIVKSVTINHVYPSTPSGDVVKSETIYKHYNSDGYPVLFSENSDVERILEYK